MLFDADEQFPKSQTAAQKIVVLLSEFCAIYEQVAGFVDAKLVLQYVALAHPELLLIEDELHTNICTDASSKSLQFKVNVMLFPITTGFAKLELVVRLFIVGGAFSV